jgi:two-component system KDP operon response regulator KdpE
MDIKVLLVKLPEEVAEYITLVLKVRWPGMISLSASEAREAAELIHSEQPHLVMLYLPEKYVTSTPGNRFDLINHIRSFSEVPIIVIGQFADDMDKVQALQMGADDWVSPSFLPMEFMAKVNAILRRCFPDKQGISSFLNGRLSIDYAARQVSVAGNPVKLTPIQYEILCHLVRNAGRVCSSAELLRHVWGPEYGDEKDILKLNVHRLRSKIEEDPSSPEIILSERGVGYVIRTSSSSE